MKYYGLLLFHKGFIGAVRVKRLFLFIFIHLYVNNHITFEWIYRSKGHERRDHKKMRLRYCGLAIN